MPPTTKYEKVAPYYDIPEKKILAIEHPMVVKNIDNAIKTFGRVPPFKRVSFLHDLFAARFYLYIASQAL
jgi:hypothetical protein